MANRSAGVARAYSIMQEQQQLRDKVCALSEKNRQLAKALTTAKQELTKAREAKNAVFSDKVAEWMKARCKPTEVHHKATQCEIEQGTRVLMENLPLEPEPPLSPQQRGGAEQTTLSDSQAEVASASMRISCGKNADAMQEYDDLQSENEEKCEDVSSPKAKTDATNSESARSSRQTLHSPLLDPSSKTNVSKRLRQRSADMSYVEPSLKTKLRRGDDYGLGKRTGSQTRPPKQRVFSEPSCRRRTMRRMQRVSYKEPKLNTKLRQGDKFTFTT